MCCHPLTGQGSVWEARETQACLLGADSPPGKVSSDTETSEHHRKGREVARCQLCAMSSSPLSMGKIHGGDT